MDCPKHGILYSTREKGVNCYHCVEWSSTQLSDGVRERPDTRSLHPLCSMCMKLRNRQNQSMAMGVKPGLVSGEGVMTGPGHAEPLGGNVLCLIREVLTHCICASPSSWTPKVQEVCMYVRI